MESVTERIRLAKADTMKELRDFEREIEWKPIPCDDPDRKRVNLYEAVRKDGIYTLKAQAHFKDCDPVKILKLNIDNFYSTRKQWETADLKNIEQVEQIVMEKINIIRYWIDVNVIGVQCREFLGIQWWKKSKHNSYLLVFKSITYDERYPCDTSLFTRGACTSIMRISKNSLVTVYTHVQPNGNIPAWILPLWKEKLRDRMLLYEKVVLKSYDDIYKDWTCDRCGKAWTVNTEKCRSCTK